MMSSSLSGGVVCSAVVPLFLSLFVLISAVGAQLSQHCYLNDALVADVEPSLCYPAIQDVARLASTSVRASSTCRWNETYCRRVYDMGLMAGPNPDVVCAKCAAQNSHSTSNKPSSFPVTNILDYDSTTAWQSSPLRQAQTKVTLDFQLQRQFLLFNVRLLFAEIGIPTLALLEGSADFGKEWKVLAVLKRYCGRERTTYPAPADQKCYTLSNLHRLVDIEILSKTLYSSTTNPAKLKALTVSHTFTNLRLVFMNVDSVVLDQDTQARRRLAPFFFYRLAEVVMEGICQCSGHASQCLASPDGSHIPQCLCAHGTTGHVCGKCGTDASKSESLSSAAFLPEKCKVLISPANANNSFRLGEPTNKPTPATALLATQPTMHPQRISTNSSSKNNISVRPTLTRSAAATRRPIDADITTEHAEAKVNTSFAHVAPSRAAISAVYDLIRARLGVTLPTEISDAVTTDTPRKFSPVTSVTEPRNTATSPTAHRSSTEMSTHFTNSSISSGRGDEIPFETFTSENSISLNGTNVTFDAENATSSVPPGQDTDQPKSYTDSPLVYAGPAGGLVLVLLLVAVLLIQHRYRKRTRSTFKPTKYSADKALKYDGLAFSNFITPQSFQARTSATSSPTASGSSQRPMAGVSDSENALKEGEPPTSLTLANPAAGSALSISSPSSLEGDAVKALAAMTELSKTTVNHSVALSTAADDTNHSSENNDDDELEGVAVRDSRRASRTKSFPDLQRRSWAPDTTIAPTYVNLKRLQTAYQFSKAEQAQALQVQLASASLPRSITPVTNTSSPVPMSMGCSNEVAYCIAPDQRSMQGSITTTGTSDELFYACSDLDLNTSLMNCSVSSSPMEPELIAALQHGRRQRRPPARAHSFQSKSTNQNASVSETEHPMPRTRVRPKRSRSVHSEAPVTSRHRRHCEKQRSSAMKSKQQRRQSETPCSEVHSDRDRPLPRPRSRRSFYQDDQQCQSDATYPGRSYPPPPGHVIDDIISIASTLSRRKTYLADPQSPPREPPATPPGHRRTYHTSSAPMLASEASDPPQLEERQRGDGECYEEQLDNMTVIDHGSEEEGDVPVLGTMMDALHNQGVIQDGQRSVVLRSCATPADDETSELPVQSGGQTNAPKSPGNGLGNIVNSTLDPGQAGIHHERTAGGNLKAVSPRNRSGESDAAATQRAMPLLQELSTSCASSTDSLGPLHGENRTSTLRTELHFDLTRSNAGEDGDGQEDGMHPESFVIHL